MLNVEGPKAEQESSTLLSVVHLGDNSLSSTGHVPCTVAWGAAKLLVLMELTV